MVSLTQCTSHRKCYFSGEKLVSSDNSARVFNTISPLHMNLQVANFQRCECASGFSKEPEPVLSTQGMSEIAACPPSPIADDLAALPSPTSPPSSGQ